MVATPPAALLAVTSLLLLGCWTAGAHGSFGASVLAASSDWSGGCACDSDAASTADPQLVGSLLEQLSEASTSFTACRQQLLRSKHHVPVVLTNPLGGVGNSSWQAACACLAVLCLAVLAQWQRSRRALAQLQRHAQVREAAWRRVVGSIRTQVQQQVEACQAKEAEWQQQLAAWQAKEAAWQQGMQAVSELVQLRQAALSAEDPQVSPGFGRGCQV
jgi:hypothetical protein